MKRRDFLKGISAFALGGAAFSQRSVGQPESSELDLYGGWKGKKFRATGFFRTEKHNRWWFVTPEGNAFLSFGINHLHMGWWAQPYNREVWQKRLGVTQARGPDFARAFRKWFMEERRRFGFNTLGVHNSRDVLNAPEPFMPYMQPIAFVDIPHWRQNVSDDNFVDIFADEFARHCDRMAREHAEPLKDDPFLLGYAMTDCPLLTEEDCRERTDVIGGAQRAARIGWPRRLRNLAGDAPGKRAYVDCVRRLYRDEIRDFNATYGTGFDSFGALAEAHDWRLKTDLSNGNETRDNIEFLKQVVAKYYKTARDAIGRYDPNHLFFGDKLNANTDTVDTVLGVTSRYTDVVFYQMYASYEVQEPSLDRWSKVTDKPSLNGDSCYAATTEIMPRPYGPIADDQQQRAQWTREFFERAFARRDFVGWHYCGMIDAPNLLPGKTGRQHGGLLNIDGTPYQPVQKVLRASADKMYRIAMSKL
jgi:hypothetical protein